MKSKKKRLLDSLDFYRLTKAVDVEDDKDFIIISWCTLQLQMKLEEYRKTHFAKVFGIIEPDAITQGLRMLLYREEVSAWRETHRKDVKAVELISAGRDFSEMVLYLKENIGRLANLIPK